MIVTDHDNVNKQDEENYDPGEMHGGWHDGVGVGRGEVIPTYHLGGVDNFFSVYLFWVKLRILGVFQKRNPYARVFILVNSIFFFSIYVAGIYFLNFSRTHAYSFGSVKLLVQVDLGIAISVWPPDFDLVLYSLYW